MHRLPRRALVALAVAALFALGPASEASAQGLLGGLLPGVLTQPEQPPPAAPPPPPPPAPAESLAPASAASAGLPEASGTGRRIVYSVSQQQMWLVEDDGRIDRSYPVSGKKGEPRAGTYRVFSKSRHARAPGGVTMEYMVRFARTTGLDIGFHAIPVGRSGRPIQSESELGEYRSKGCVRQSAADAAYLWDWAPMGTAVVVTP